MESRGMNVFVKIEEYKDILDIIDLIQEKIKEAKSIPSYRKVFRQKGKHKFKDKMPEPDHIELIRTLGKEKLPCLFFTFSRKDCQKKAVELARKYLFKKDPEILTFVNAKLREAPSEINKLKSVQMLKESISQGIAFHHAGLLPVMKEIVEELFGQGKINVLYATETFAVGINMPAKTVCFSSLRKYDGISFRLLNTKEYFQIAGRAGRRGIDTVGYVVSMIYRPTFHYHEVKRLTAKDIEPIHSHFKLSVNTVLNLIDQKTPEEIEKILRLSFFSYQKFGDKYATIPTKVLLARYNSIVRKLTKYEFIKDKKLTPKGYFSSKIFADEITFGQIFATPLAEKLDEYQILLVLASLVYEPRMGHKFKQKFRDESLKKLKSILRNNEFLAREKKFLQLDIVTVFIHPIYNGKTFFDVLDFMNLLEGDLIRLYSQILDRIGQVLKATTDYKLKNKMINCQSIVTRALEGIYLV